MQFREDAGQEQGTALRVRMGHWTWDSFDKPIGLR